jgi:hypothetical protein
MPSSKDDEGELATVEGGRESTLIFQVLPVGLSTVPTVVVGGLLELHRADPSAPLDEVVRIDLWNYSTWP